MPYITCPAVPQARRRTPSATHSHHTLVTRRSALSTRSIVWFLTLALLFAQTLGLMHSAVHGSGSAGTGAASASMAKGGDAGQGAIASLFSSHASDADCRLYDQASHGSAALHVASLALPVLLPSLAVAIFEGEALARWAALFDARGPPLTR